MAQAPRQGVPGRGDHKSKVPGVEMSLTGSRKTREANVLVQPEQGRERKTELFGLTT